MAVSLTKEYFGKTSKGKDIYKFTFSYENKVTLSVLNYGCVIYEIKTPDKDGKVVDINLGYDKLADYEINNNYLGALCGRVANRIGHAKFQINGNEYNISKNDTIGGGHFVHGGFVGYSRSAWSWDIKDDHLILSLTDPDGNEGLPGEVVTHVTLSFDNNNVFTMDYKATTTKPTPIDMGSHFMVNLAGHGHGSIKDHRLMIKADKFLKAGEDFLPTGEIAPVDGTALDFRLGKLMDIQTMESLPGGSALHHALCIGDPQADRRKKKMVGRVDHEGSGRYMEVYSTNTTVFGYSNYFMERILGNQPCKDGVVYKQYGAIELMPMGYPNAVNQPTFPTSIVNPGETYHETAWYKFGVLV